MSTVFVVICCDHHTDDAIEVHTTREGADAALDEWVDSFGDDYEWDEDGAHEHIVFSMSVEDGGYSARIERHEVKP